MNHGHDPQAFVEDPSLAVRQQKEVAMIEIPLERAQQPWATAQHVLDIYKALGIEWGQDPFAAIERLKRPSLEGL